jgi:hypothetical protein
MFLKPRLPPLSLLAVPHDNKIHLDNTHLAGKSNQDEAKITKSTRASLDVAESRYEAHNLLEISFETGPHAPLHAPEPP